MIIIFKKIYHFLFNKLENIIFFLIQKNFFNIALVLSLIFSKIFLRKFSNKNNYNSVEELFLKISKLKFQKKYKIKKILKFNKKNRILFLIPKAGGGDIENIFVDTAKNYGISVDLFYTEKVSYKNKTEKSNLKNLNLAYEKISKKIEKLKPNLIFIDCNYLGNKNTINNSFIKSLRKKFKFKIVGFMGDFYSKEAFIIQKYWSKSLDFIFHFEPSYKKFIQTSKKIKKLYFLPYFLNDKDFDFRKKKYDIFFSGILNIVRLPYLVFLRQNVKKFFLRNVIFFHDLNNYNKNTLSLSRKKYTYYLTSSKIIINLTSRKAPGVRIFTGRSVQAISSKSLALEEKNESMEKLYVPYKHYIPFDSIKELSITLKFIKKYPKLIECIINESYMHYCNNYRSDIGWKKIFKLSNLSIK